MGVWRAQRQRAWRWPGCSGRLLSGGDSILSNFLPTVNGFLVFAIENSFERPHVLVTHDPTEILLGRQHGRSSPTLRHRLAAPQAYSPGPLSVQLWATVGRYRCRNPACSRKIFC